MRGARLEQADRMQREVCRRRQLRRLIGGVQVAAEAHPAVVRQAVRAVEQRRRVAQQADQREPLEAEGRLQRRLLQTLLTWVILMRSG